MYPGMRSIPCTILRAGTSKGIYLRRNDLPADETVRDRVILSIFGSPDKRQIDGLGGADPLTSKLAIVGPSDRPDADVEYTFGQVSIDRPQIFYKSICGNITSGVGPFAVNNNLVKVAEGITTVRIYNTNTEKIITAYVPTTCGRACVDGDLEIAGVPGTGAKISLDFSKTTGALSGHGVLPTGNAIDRIDVAGVGPIDVSIVDVAACQVFIRARDVGLDGSESPTEIDSRADLLEKLEAIRAHAAYLAGLAETPVSATTDRRNTPHLAMIGEGGDYIDHLTAGTVRQEDYDVRADMLFMQIMHKTYAGTGSICLGVAARIPGTIPNLGLTEPCRDGIVRIGHPAGVIPIEAEVECGTDGIVVRRAAIQRTARTIMEGFVYVRENIFESSGE